MINMYHLQDILCVVGILIGIYGIYSIGHDAGYQKALDDIKKIMEKGK